MTSLLGAPPGSGSDSGTGATITPYEDGPLLIRGDFTLRTPDGTAIEPGRGTVALCRCGKSAIKPFCDGTHKAIGFRAGTARESDPARENQATQDGQPARENGPARNGEPPRTTD